MLEVRCCGTPFEIGHQHGCQAKQKVHGSLDFYKGLFQRTCAFTWDDVLREASKFEPSLEQKHPRYLEEIRGIAKGAGVGFLDILALNVRTEITFGLFTEQPKVDDDDDDDDDVPPLDGCTSIACKARPDQSFLGQNWDWMVEQAPNIFVCHVSQQPGTAIPDFTMITEGGVIGKIGLNAKGVGVCLNAIRARGVDSSKLPIHLALRVALESPSMDAAVKSIEAFGVAGSAHILVGDVHGSIGLECTSIGTKRLDMDQDGVIVHTNHLLLEHTDVDEPQWLKDSPNRNERMRSLVKESLSSEDLLDTESFMPLFKDEDGYPTAINRHQIGESKSETVFTIVMDLAVKRAEVSFGRPTQPIDHIAISY